MSKPQLGYWDIRGLAAPLRYMLAYAGEDFEDVRYSVGPAPQYSREGWFKVKFTLGLDFPNLPYYIDDKVKLTETNAIFRYLARKYNLYGDDPVTMAQVDLILEATMDLRNGFVRLCYGADKEHFDEKKKEYCENVAKKLDTFQASLGDKKFFAGDKLTVCDFHIYEMLDQHLTFEPDLVESRPKLKAFWRRFNEIPQIAAHLASAAFKERPINNVMAAWY